MTDRVNVLVYDGDCGFCTASAAWITRRWKGTDSIVLPYQRLDRSTLDRPGVVDADFERRVWWLSDDGNAAGADAIGQALLATHDFWAVVGRVVMSAPFKWIAPTIYDTVARHRHHLPGATPACSSQRPTSESGHAELRSSESPSAE